MRNLLQKLNNIIVKEGIQVDYTGIIIHLLTSEQDPYKSYVLNIEDNETFEKILKANFEYANVEDIRISDYVEESKPNFPEEVSYLDLNDIPKYAPILDSINRNNTNRQNRNFLSKKNLKDIVPKSKGYVIQVMYNESGEDKSIFAYFRMTKSAFLTGEEKVFKFGGGQDESLLKESNEPQLKFGEKLVSAAIEDKMFIFSGNDFEILLKYDELVNSSSVIALDNMATKHLINDFDEFRGYCEGSILMKRKLHKIRSKGNLDNISVDDFRRVKNVCGDKLMVDINNDNTISFNPNKKKQSIEHILRIYNDEGAETIISRKPIFADKKIEM